MDDEGRMIAVPNSEQVIKPTNDEFVPPKVDELGDDVLTAAFDRFRVEGKGRRILEFEGTNYISSVTALPGQISGSLMTLALSLQHANGERAQLIRQTQMDNP